MVGASLSACFLGDNPNFMNADGASTSVGTSAGTDPMSTTATTSTASTAGTTAGTTANTTTGQNTSQAGSTGSSSPTYAAEVLADQPLAYWRLGEDFGPDCIDAVGQFPGTYEGAIGWETPGAIAGDDDTAVQFGGEAAKVLFGDVLDLAGPPSLTVEAWVHPDQITTGYPAILRKQIDVGWSLIFIDYDTMSAGFVYYYEPNVNRGVFGKVEPNEWTHVVATHDGSTMRMYINAVEVDALVTDFAIPDTDAILAMGAYQETGGAFPGAIDEVAIYDHALPPSRIETHYQLGLGQ